MAWLHAMPKPPQGTQRAIEAAKPGQPAPQTRLEEMKSRNIEPQMPPNPAPHIITWLIDMGITGSTGMGKIALSWTEIDAWRRMTGLNIDPWVARLIRHLSSVYISEGRKAEDETCPPPWRAEVTQREKQLEGALLRAVLS